MIEILELPRGYTFLDECLQLGVGILFPAKAYQEVDVVDAVILIILIQRHRLGIIILCQLQHAPLLLYSATSRIR